MPIKFFNSTFKVVRFSNEEVGYKLRILVDDVLETL